MKATLRNLWLVTAVTLLAFGASPAQVATKSATASPDYSQEAVVIERLASSYSFSSDGTATGETTARVRIQSDAGAQQFGVLMFPYQKATESLEIVYVRVRKPDGAVVVTPPDYVQDMPSEVTRVAPLYSDLRQLHVAVKGLAPGDILEYQSRDRVQKPIVPGQFWFQYNFSRDSIVLDEELQISVPRDRPVKLKSADVQPVTSDEGPRRTYTWKTSNLRRKTDAEKAKESKRDLPPPSVQLSSFRSWEEVGNWYRELQRTRLAPSPEIRAKAAELTRNATADGAKLNAIYHYVSSEFRYIGLDFGVGLYQPHSAADVLANQYGDCKDKETLLASLLQAVGITAYPVLINSTRKIDVDVPSPAQFDHLIGVVPMSLGPRVEVLVFMDTTAEVAPVGYLVPPLRDKLALVVRDTPVLLKTSADPPNPMVRTFDAEATLNSDGTLEAKVENTMRGDFEIAPRLGFRRVPQPQWKQLAQMFSYASNFGGTVDQVHASSPVATDEPFKFGYSYLRKEYADWPNRRILPPLPPVNLPPAPEEDDVSGDPVELGSPATLAFHSRLKLPTGYSVELPAAVDLTSDFAEYHASSEFKDGVLYSERRLTLLARRVPASRRAEYRKFLKAISDEYSTYIALEKTSDGTATATVARPDDAEARRLFDKAREALQFGDLTATEDYLKRLLARDPKYPRAWYGMGLVAERRNQLETAVEHMQKEIALHPDDALAYNTLAEIQITAQRPQDAAQTWRSLLKVLPEDRDAIVKLSSLLVRQKQFAEAVQVAETGIKLDPNSSSLLFAYANACLWAGQTEKALAGFDKLVELDPTPLTLNNAAYQLAENNIGLERARRWAERAVAETEADTRTVNLSSLQTYDLRRPLTVAAYWDTLGWVCFRQGELSCAEEYLASSWVLTQDPAVADHLGQLYERQGKKRAATHTYELALATHRAPAGLRERLQRLRPEAPTLRVRTASSGGLHMSGGDELSRMRTVHLPALSGKGSAEFWLEFAPGAKVEEVKFVSGADELRDAAKALPAAHFDVRFPQGSQARIVRRAILACYAASGCDVVLMTPDSVFSPD